jgi:uncharacterized protein (DUF697 family)
VSAAPPHVPGAPGVPGFDVERRLGAGASCEVWLAREREGLRRPVALKVFVGAPDAYRRELEVVRRVEELRREARCGGLVQSLATGEAEGLGFIAFEWLEDGTLEARVTSGGPLPFAEAVDVVRQVATALALLHRGNLFHRDVKPSNLLLGRDGRVRVADFGLSRPLDGTLSAAGSPAFAAPEAIAGKPQDGRKLDVYSLGATLAWLLTGETMLPGRPDVFLLERHGVPRPLQRVIVRAMACDPEERIATADELLAALDDPGQAPAPPPAPAPAEDVEPPPADPTARRRAWDLVERTGYAAAAATALPLPGSEWVVVLPLHVTMVVGISEVYDCRLDQASATDLLRRLGASVGLSYVGSRAATSVAKLLLPGVGGVAGAVVVYASTLAIGGVVIAFFERGGALDEAELRALYREGLASAPRSFDPSRAGREPPGSPTRAGASSSAWRRSSTCSRRA